MYLRKVVWVRYNSSKYNWNIGTQFAMLVIQSSCSDSKFVRNPVSEKLEWNISQPRSLTYEFPGCHESNRITWLLRRLNRNPFGMTLTDLQNLIVPRSQSNPAAPVAFSLSLSLCLLLSEKKFSNGVNVWNSQRFVDFEKLIASSRMSCELYRGGGTVARSPTSYSRSPR